MYSLLYKWIIVRIFKKFNIMNITSYTNFRNNLKTFLDKVLAEHSPLYVTRANSEDVVVLSKADYESMQETFSLLSNPANASRLLDGINEYNNSGGKEKELIEE